MDRLYGDHRCYICNRLSGIGWIYCCTQDEEIQFLPADMSIKAIDTNVDLASMVNNLTTEATPPESRPQSAETVDTEITKPTPELSPWIEQAIQDGHYTPEHIDILRAQKQKVIDTAKATLERWAQTQATAPSTPSTLTTTTTTSSTSTSTSTSLDSNPHLPFPTFTTIREPPPTPSSIDSPSKIPKNSMFPYCDFRACQLCRPSFRDRTWQCLEPSHLQSPPSSIAAIDDGNRPLSSASLLRKIGLSKTPRFLAPAPARPRLRHSSSRGLHTINPDGNIIFHNKSSRIDTNTNNNIPLESTDITDATTTTDTQNKSFRESMKTALKTIIPTPRESTLLRNKRRVRESSTGEEDPAEVAVGSWIEANDALLDEASRVPLPEDGEVEVVLRGEAIMEEAVEVGGADIIVSV